jgi:hypothetical protein
MPRKPKKEKHVTTVLVNNVPVRVILHPPAGRRKCWYAYWPGLAYSVSTGKRELNKAIIEATRLVQNQGKPVQVQQNAGLSDEAFKAIQQAHFAAKRDPAGRARAAKSLKDCWKPLRRSGSSPA